jgi:hypothetical protein
MIVSNPPHLGLPNSTRSFCRKILVGFLLIRSAAIRCFDEAEYLLHTARKWLRDLFRFGAVKARHRAAVYVRYQAHVVDPNIVNDQMVRCAQYAESIGANVTQVFKDESGGGRLILTSDPA